MSTTTPFKRDKIKVYTFDTKRPVHCNFENSLSRLSSDPNFVYL